MTTVIPEMEKCYKKIFSNILIKYFSIVTCLALYLENGELSYNESLANGEYAVDTMVYFTCNYGFENSGTSSAVCQTTGTWDQETPTCIQGTEINYNNILHTR